MDDVNPFQSPTTDLIDRASADIARPYWVDGDYLVVTSGAVLPPVCVVTNRPVTEGDMLRKQFTWCTPWVALFILLNVLLLLLFYFILRKTCWITFGLDPDVRWKYRKRILLKFIATFVLLFAVIVTAASDLMAPTLIALVLLLATLVWLCFGNSAISVAKHRKGMFWIKGVSRAYLANLRATGPPPR